MQLVPSYSSTCYSNDDDDDDDGADDDAEDEYTNLYLSASYSFYSYIPHLPSLSPSPPFTIPLF